ncbi:putative low-specificity L-threonine aldolase 2 [Portunus trituberculatus]|uniref:Putative low-specificity L-threonine aldolase 2 n=1 Tax=Portunus trituberculatus TaxID=210409 RepID=A0A5B7DE63_PORTR|nr:putative low-specificity L-threonine aldolase 2 [Portunus trituberculatus]
MEVTEEQIGRNVEETEAEDGGEITLATINTNYLKGPITVTSFKPQSAVISKTEEGKGEDEGEEEEAGGELIEKKCFNDEYEEGLENQDQDNDDDDHKKSKLGLSLHCDGARLMNAAVALGTSPARLVQACDSATLCLNKGLGAPMGSVIAGTRDFITRAQKMRKIMGGGLHQAGMMAAAGLWALDHRVPKLSADHTNARAIAQCVQEEHSSAITVDLKSVQTNIVLLHCDNIRVDAKKLCQRLSSVTDREAHELGEQVVVMMMPLTDTCVRFMTHCDVRKDEVKTVIKKLRYVIQEYDNMITEEVKTITDMK